MFGSLPWPLALALVLSYVGMTVVVTVAVNLTRWSLRASRSVLLAGLAVGAASVVLRTTYFLLV